MGEKGQQGSREMNPTSAVVPGRTPEFPPAVDGLANAEGKCATHPTGDLPERSAGLGAVLRWTWEGVRRGPRAFVPSAAAALAVLPCCVLLVLASHISSDTPPLIAIALALMGLGGFVFLFPAMIGGFWLTSLGVARGEGGVLRKAFGAFKGGGFGRCLKVVWMYMFVALPAVAISLALWWLIDCKMFYSWGSFLEHLVDDGTLLLFAGGFQPVYHSGLLWGQWFFMGLWRLLLAGSLVFVILAPAMFLMSRLYWAVPLVVEGRATVGRSIRLSWKQTSRVAGGSGMFVAMMLLNMVLIVGCAAIVAGVSVAAGAREGAKYPEAQKLATINADRQAAKSAGFSVESDIAQDPVMEPIWNTAAFYKTCGLTIPLDPVRRVSLILCALFAIFVGGALNVSLAVGYREMCDSRPKG